MPLLHELPALAKWRSPESNLRPLFPHLGCLLRHKQRISFWRQYLHDPKRILLELHQLSWYLYLSSGQLESTAEPTASTPLTSCPQAPSYIVAGNRILYEICLDTDYEIPSPEIASNIPDNRSCGNQCSAQQGCTKAVYNPSVGTCWLKGNPTTANANWQKHSGYQTLDRVPVNTPLTQCLAPTYTIVQNGVTYVVCPSSHLNSATVLNYWTNIQGEYQCAQLCNSVSNCKKFVYDWNSSTCFNVGNVDLAKAGWATYDNINTYWTI